jgi:hypothetical protein
MVLKSFIYSSCTGKYISRQPAIQVDVLNGTPLSGMKNDKSNLQESL